MSISIKNLHYTVKDQKLLRGINGNINEPEVIGIVGPNGAGKSTLLNCISGLFSVSGSVQMDGLDVAAYSGLELARKRAVLTQQSPLSFPFKAREVVAMSFSLSALSRSEQDRLVQKSLAVLSAAHLADRDFLSLSGGEKQRVHLARVMAQLLMSESTEGMRYLMLDEPTAPLDLKHQYQLFDFLKTLPAQNIAVLMVIHDLNQAAHCCDRIWLMSDGRLVADGKPAEVITQGNLRQHFDIEVDVSIHQNIPQINRGLL